MRSKTHDSICIGLVGASGLVGQTFLRILEERGWRPRELKLFSSESSEGKRILFQGREHSLLSLPQEPDRHAFKGLDLVFFSAGDDISKKHAPQAVDQGAYVVDNSAAFRMDPKFPLVVPECNGDQLKGLKLPTIISNPNCSTIQLVIALMPFLSLGALRSVRVATYQSVSGAGLLGQQELKEQIGQIAQRDGHPDLSSKVFARQIAYNLVPQIGSFDEFGFSTEENKIMMEARRILELPKLMISAFTVRVPVLVGHSEVVWVEMDREIVQKELIQKFESNPGVVISKNFEEYPTPLEIAGQNQVFVGRLHQDRFDPRCWLMWVVSDNLRKGAAYNGVQIAEQLLGLDFKRS